MNIHELLREELVAFSEYSSAPNEKRRHHVMNIHQHILIWDDRTQWIITSTHWERVGSVQWIFITQYPLRLIVSSILEVLFFAFLFTYYKYTFGTVRDIEIGHRCHDMNFICMILLASIPLWIIMYEFTNSHIDYKLVFIVHVPISWKWLEKRWHTWKIVEP